MRGSAFMLALLFMGSQTVQAGLYNPAEPGEGKLNPDFKIFRDTLFSLRDIRIEPGQVNGPLQKRILDKVLNDPFQMRYRMMQQSAPRLIPPDWNLAQRLSLSAYLIRRGKYTEAIEFLKPLSRKERDNFLVHANLSTAFFLAGQEPALAYDYLDQALACWPEKWNALENSMKGFLERIGWDEIKFRDNRLAETYQLKLIKLRRLEKAKKEIRADNVDDLFGIHFVGESGGFEPGKLAAKEKLPPNALSIVQQLLVWSPNDLRLYWLLGEVYNAQGKVADAMQILEDLQGTYRPTMLANHLNILRAAPKQTEPGVNPENGSKPPGPTESSNPTSFDVRSLLVGIFVGIALSVFAYWQFREIRRRRRV
jgi:tetratricopeptide (TPR) repeat protein